MQRSQASCQSSGKVRAWQAIAALTPLHMLLLSTLSKAQCGGPSPMQLLLDAVKLILTDSLCEIHCCGCCDPSGSTDEFVYTADDMK